MQYLDAVFAKRARGNVLMFWLPRRFLISIKRKTTGMDGSSRGWSTATANSVPSPVATRTRWSALTPLIGHLG